MKVCTDSCLFGAWTADIIQQKNIEPLKILDIGTGTGLLSLMLAQKASSTAIFDAIELDENACKQAQENFIQSPWSNQLQVIHGKLQDYSAAQPYDFIVCNPPFYAENLHSPDVSRNAAMHDTGLSLKELMQSINALLSSSGFTSILIPSFRTVELAQLASENNLFVQHKTNVKQTPKHTAFRTMILFGRNEVTVNQEELIIHDEGKVYNPAFVHLLKDYYLYL